MREIYTNYIASKLLPYAKHLFNISLLYTNIAVMLYMSLRTFESGYETTFDRNIFGGPRLLPQLC